MTIEECYVKMGANYQDVIKRLPSAKMIEKFALKFKDDTSFQELETALNEKQVELALQQFDAVKEQYTKTIDALNEFVLENE